jgi:hypothetical protein
MASWEDLATLATGLRILLKAENEATMGAIRRKTARIMRFISENLILNYYQYPVPMNRSRDLETPAEWSAMTEGFNDYVYPLLQLLVSLVVADAVFVWSS